MLIIDGASHLVLNELGREINSLVAGLEILKELYRLQVQQHFVSVDNPSGSMNTLQLRDIAVGLSDGIAHSKPPDGAVFLELRGDLHDFIRINANQTGTDVHHQIVEQIGHRQRGVGIHRVSGHGFKLLTSVIGGHQEMMEVEVLSSKMVVQQ